MRTLFLAVAGVVAGGLIGSASAAPLTRSAPAADVASPVTQVQGYRYRKDCVWINKGWGYRDRHGKVLVCRPYKPSGSGWYWHSEGGRHGWYHRQRKHWHHKW